MATRSVPQPPFSAELLADLHADNIDPDLAARLWPVVRADADAAGYLRDLDEVSSRVRALGADDRIVHRMPGEVADRLTAFLDDLDDAPDADRTRRLTRLPDSHPPGTGMSGPASGPPVHPRHGPADAEEPIRSPSTPSGPLSAPTQLRPRRHLAAWAGAAAATVAILAGAAMGLRVLDTGTDTPPVAQPTTEVGDELNGTAALAALGRHEVSGPLGDTAALESCVRAAGLDRPVLGAMNLTYRGSEAVLILLAGPQKPKITALVVGPGCTVDDPQVLDITDIG